MRNTCRACKLVCIKPVLRSSDMSSKKHIYKVTIGTQPAKWRNVFTYTYGHTKGIEIGLVRGSAFVAASIGATYDGCGVLSSSNRLFVDALRKTYLLHLIVYSEQLSFERLTVFIDGEAVATDAEPTMAGLIDQRKLIRRVPTGALSAGVARNLLGTTKMAWSALDASLNSYLYSRSKVFEADRLQCLWPAMNGLYNEVSRRAIRHQDANVSDQENAKICKLLRVYGLGSRFTSPKDWKPLAQQVQSILREAPSPATRDVFENSPLAGRIECAVRNTDGAPDVTPYGFVLMGMSYHYRCMLFHGNSPLPLYAHADDGLLAGLRVCNDLLEEFLDENLFLWLDREYADTVFEQWITREFGALRLDGELAQSVA